MSNLCFDRERTDFSGLFAQGVLYSWAEKGRIAAAHKALRSGTRVAFMNEMSKESGDQYDWDRLLEVQCGHIILPRRRCLDAQGQ
jgi:hypothetical protein